MKATQRNSCLAGLAILAMAAVWMFFRSPGQSQGGPEQGSASPTEPPVLGSTAAPPTNPGTQVRSAGSAASPVPSGLTQSLLAVTSPPYATGTSQPGVALPTSPGTPPAAAPPSGLPVTPRVIVPPEVRVTGPVPQSGTNRDYSPR